MFENVIELYDGVKLHMIETEKFKTNFIGIFIITNLNRKNVTKNALIPAVLKRGTENLNTMKDISIKLEELYGSVLDASSDKIGDKQVLQFYITSIGNEYAVQDENLLEESIDILCDVIIKPKKENGMFLNTYVEQEKENLKKLIESKINNKGAYAIDRCIEEMYEGMPFGLYKLGYVDDLYEITSEILFEQYEKILSTSEIHIYISGKFSKEKISSKFSRRFNEIKRNYDATKINDEIKINIHRKEPKKVIEKQDVTQGKLVLGYKSDIQIKSSDTYKMILFNAILGGTPNSKLFQNVREKASLAYTVRSIYIKQKGSFLISAGIEINEYEKALDLIRIQVEDIKAGKFSEEDINDAKISLESAYRSYIDEQVSIINLYMGQELIGFEETIDDMIENIKSVNKEDIIDVANRTSLDTIYFLTSK